MDAIKAQIEAKKQQLQHQPQKQYKRRGELKPAAAPAVSLPVTSDISDDSNKKQKTDGNADYVSSRDDTSAANDTTVVESVYAISTPLAAPGDVNPSPHSSQPSVTTAPHTVSKAETADEITTLSDIQRSKYDSDEQYIQKFFKHILRAWRTDVEKPITTTTDTQAASQHRKQLQQYTQTKQYIKPLFVLLRHKQVGSDMLTNLNHIVQHCVVGQYIKANEYYLLLAIGRAAWPMGVTMVGIHERAGREKLHSDSIAHVLNDETARKYIQSVKRCVTVCAQLYPNKGDNWAVVKATTT